MRTAEREQVEKVIEQELAGILLRAVRLAEREGEPLDFKGGAQLILRVLEERREERQKAQGGGVEAGADSP